MNEILKRLIAETPDGVLKGVQLMIHGQITPGDIAATDWDGVYRLTLEVMVGQTQQTMKRGRTTMYVLADACTAIMLPPEMSSLVELRS